jgi:hypothetical protein
VELIALEVVLHPHKLRSPAMDWDRVQGSWKQLEGKLKAKWGKLTADDLTAINGRNNSKVSFNSSMACRRTKFARRLMTGSPRKASSEPLG